MNNLLENPVYNALSSGDSSLSRGNDSVKYFDEAVSPFAGFDTGNQHGFEELHSLLPAGRKILYANPLEIKTPEGWKLQHHIKGLQFVYAGNAMPAGDFSNVIKLSENHIDQMVNLAMRTKPGPFASRTIEFGHYHGIFDGDKLVAMTGQRLHVDNCSEISAVCTDPLYTGKGYAGTLMLHQLNLILQEGQVPFLHVRADNERAIALYKRLGFQVSRPMQFYFMKRD